MIKISLSSVLKIVWLFIPVLFFLLYCDDTQSRTRDRLDNVRKDEKDPLRTEGDPDYYGKYNRSEYDKSKCSDLDDTSEEYKECSDICDKVYDSQRKECERLPLDLIQDLDLLFEKMKRLRANQNQLKNRVDDYNFGVMIDIHIEPVSILLQQWSVRELTEFLIWVAETSSVSLALKEHDPANEILKEAFRLFGAAESLPSGTGYLSDLEYGIGKNLKGAGSTFLILAEDAKNKAGFEVLHQLIDSLCSTKQCKMKFYCARDEFDRSFRNRQNCHYQTDDRRSFNRDNYCYRHGPNIWSYWEKLNREDRFNDNDFLGTAPNINENLCNSLCNLATVNCKM